MTSDTAFLLSREDMLTILSKIVTLHSNLLACISILVYSLLVKSCDRFKYTPRARDTLPAGFPEDIPGTCYFLDGYTPTRSDPIDCQLFFSDDPPGD